MDMRIYTICPSFQEILLSGFRGVVLTNCLSSIFHFGQKSKFKKGVDKREKNWIKVSCGCAHLHIMSFITIKFQEILLSGFRGVALTRKIRLTDWRTDGSNTLYPPQLVAWGITIVVYHMCLYLYMSSSECIDFLDSIRVLKKII